MTGPGPFTQTYSTHISNRKIYPLLPSHLDPNGGDLGSSDYTGELPDIKNVQGDIYMLLPKSSESFMFFIISNARQFKSDLAHYVPTTSYDVLHHLHAIAQEKDKVASGASDVAYAELAATNIGLTRSGLNFLGQTQQTEDARFDKGSMRQDLKFLGDGGPWDPLFDRGNLHGVFIVCGSNRAKCNAEVASIKQRFKSSITGLTILAGNARPPPYRGFEPFGYKDSVSQPALRGLVQPHRGQLQVDPGVIILGYQGDPIYDNPNLTAAQKRPAWTKDGTFMVFRKLEQDVPEFGAYIKANGPKWRQFVPAVNVNPPLNNNEGAELFGARMVGRWKSGTSLAMAPYRDDPKIAKDSESINNFDYSVPGYNEPTEIYCPFVAHSRKTWPRNLDPYVSTKFIESSAMVRAGIPYGPEVTPSEAASGKSEQKRGLLFSCYQSNLDSGGFILQTKGFSGNLYFPITSLTPQFKGIDPITGGPLPVPQVVDINVAVSKQLQNTPNGPNPLNITDGPITIRVENSSPNPVQISGIATSMTPAFQSYDSTFGPQQQQFFVTSRGGEYFFMPSISTLKSLMS